MTCPPHHWLLPSPNGTPTLTGRCRKCGAEREMVVSEDGLGYMAERRNKQNRAAEASRRVGRKKGART